MSIMAVARAALPWTLVLLVFLVIVTYVPVSRIDIPPEAREKLQAARVPGGAARSK